MLFVPQSQNFQWYYSNMTNTRPTTTGFGTSVASAFAPSFGSWVQLASSASMAQDTYGVLINLNNTFSSTTVRNYLVDIGVDNDGGTNYTTLIPTLVGGCAPPYGTGSGGFWYYFPIYIKAGSSVAARATHSSGGSAVSVYVNFFGQPRNPEAVKVGSYVDAFGINLTEARGTTRAVDAVGTTAVGNWMQIGSNTTRSYWWAQSCLWNGEPSLNAGVMHIDLAVGDTTSKKIIYEDQYAATTTLEQVSNYPVFPASPSNIAAGKGLYMRGQYSGTPQSGLGFAAWALGG